MVDDTLIIPLVGYGMRFSDRGYSLPKQMLQMQGMTTLEYSLQSLEISSDTKVIVLLRPGLMTTHDLRPLFEKKYQSQVEFIEVPVKTRGSLETCLYAEKLVDPDSRLHIFTLDIKFEPSINLSDIDFSGADAQISLVKINNPGFSYAEVDNNTGMVKRVAEKLMISNYGATGLYSFARASDFFSLSKDHISCGLVVNPEFYISEIFDKYISSGRVANSNFVDRIYSFGTPREYEWCLRNIKSNINRIAIASDHSGYDAKLKLAHYISSLGYDVVDVGCFSENPCDYPDYVNALGKEIISARSDFGISICRSGQGVNISANKIPGIRSCLFSSLDNLEVAFNHNLPNHLALPSDMLEKALTPDFMKVISSSKFDGGRHQDRLMAMEP